MGRMVISPLLLILGDPFRASACLRANELNMVTTGSPIRIVNVLTNVMDSRGNPARFHKSGIKIADAFSEPRRIVTLVCSGKRLNRWHGSEIASTCQPWTRTVHSARARSPAPTSTATARIRIIAEMAMGCCLRPLFRLHCRRTELIIVPTSRMASSSEIVAANDVTLCGTNSRHGLWSAFDKCAQDRQRQVFVVGFSHVVELGGKPKAFRKCAMPLAILIDEATKLPLRQFQL